MSHEQTHDRVGDIAGAVETLDLFEMDRIALRRQLRALLMTTAPVNDRI